MSIALGPFDLLEAVARGGMAVVFRGVHRELGVEVGVKVLTAEEMRNPTFLEFFRNEARIMAGLSHPSIVTVFDYGEISAAAAARSPDLVEGAPFLVMEWASGGTLHEHRPTSWAELSAILRALLAALAHAHARGIVHRDLKAANVLLCTDRDARPGLKLADFGIAHPPDLVKDKAAGSGTPAYMSPEQIAGESREQGPWTDLYALGCLAFRLASGRLPFSGKPSDVYGAHLSHAIPPLEPTIPVSPDFEAWIGRLMRKLTHERFVRAADASYALERMTPPAFDRVSSPGSPLAAEVPDPTVAVSEPAAPDTIVTPGPTVAERAETHLSAAGSSALEPHTRAPDAAAAPPLPEGWRASELPQATTPPLGVGLGLYGLREIPLVDRETERDSLWEALSEVVATGKPSLVLLRGPSGCGKSRLARWLCEHAHEVGAATPLESRQARIPGPTDGLGPMLARHLRCPGLEPEGVADRVERFLVGLDIDDPVRWAAVTSLVSPDAAQTRVHRVSLRSPAERDGVLSGVLERLAARRPVILWIDDAQWGARALRFARRVLRARDEQPMPLLLVATVRDEALAEQPAESALVESLVAHPATRSIPVGPLPVADQATLVSELLGLTGALAEQVRARTGGNAMFAVQLVGDWVERGLLVPGRWGFRLADDVTVPDLPDSLHEVWRHRIEALLGRRPEPEARALEIAAVLGQDVHYGEWRDACLRASAEPATAMVEQLVRRRLATCDERGPTAGWAFVHGMLRESVLRRAHDSGRIADHHRACAEMLERRGGSPERLGHHLLSSGDAAGALDPLLEGVRLHLHGGDDAVALSVLAERDRAVAQLGLGADDRACVDGWLLQSRLLRLAGRFDEGEDVAARAEEAGGLASWADVEAEALRERGLIVQQRGEPERAWPLLTRSLTIAERAGRETRALTLRAMADSLRMRGEAGEAAARYGEALEVFKALADVEGMAACQMGLGAVARVDGRLTEASGYLSAAHESFERCGARRMAALSLLTLADVTRDLGDDELARARYGEAAALFRAVGSPDAVYAELNLGVVEVLRGAHVPARRILERVRRTLAIRGVGSMLGAAHVGLLVCAASEGKLRRFDEHLERAAELLAESGFVDPDIARLAGLAADAVHDLGEDERAREAYGLSLAQWRAIGRDERVAAVQERIATLDADPSGGGDE